MHNPRAGNGQASVSALRVYLGELVGKLDDSTLRATLQLMIGETRSAIHKQRGLIALERLDGRNTAGRIDELRDLEAAQNELITLSAQDAADTEEDVSVHHWLLGVIPFVLSKTAALPVPALL